MSKKWIINREGNVAGPLTTQQLQQMVAAGTLLSHHMVREERSPRWSTAGSIRGLFAPAPPAPAMPVAAPAPAASPGPEESAPWQAAEVEPAPVESAFDFFNAPAASPPPLPPAPTPPTPPPPAAKAPPAKPAPAPAKPAALPTPIPAPATTAPIFEPPAVEVAEALDDNPFNFGPTLAPPPPPGPKTPTPARPSPPEAVIEKTAPSPKVDDAVPQKPMHPEVPVLETAEENPFAFAGPVAPVSPPKPEAKPEPVVPLRGEIVPAAPAPLDETPAAEPEPAGAPAVAIPVPAAQAHLEITGQAIDLLPDETIRLHDGKTTLRVGRAWLQALTRYKDGSQRTAYLRLQQIDAAVLDSRFEIGRGRVTPHPVLVFQAGEAAIGIVLSSADKAARAFAERVLLAASGLPKPGGK